MTHLRMTDLDARLLLKVVYQTSHVDHYHGCEIIDRPHMHHGVSCDECHACSCGWPADRKEAIDMLRGLLCE